MFLRYSVYFLIAGLYLSSSAPTPEDCQRLVKPLPLDDLTKIHGRWNFRAAFADHPMFNLILKTVDSSWMTLTSPPSSNNVLTVNQQNMMNGKCNSSSFNMSVVDNTIKVEQENATFTAQILPSCADCAVLSVNVTVKDVDVTFRILYILGRPGEESGLETFRQQVECLGFPQPPNYQHNTEKDFCPAVEV
ncbi:uncharacterized protein LOC144542861 [Centroberyx gerrardi]